MTCNAVAASRLQGKMTCIAVAACMVLPGCQPGPGSCHGFHRRSRDLPHAYIQLMLAVVLDQLLPAAANEMLSQCRLGYGWLSCMHQIPPAAACMLLISKIRPCNGVCPKTEPSVYECLNRPLCTQLTDFTDLAAGSAQDEPLLHPLCYHKHEQRATGNGPWLHGAKLLHLDRLRHWQLLHTNVRPLHCNVAPSA